jgi:hypothetical protein
MQLYRYFVSQSSEFCRHKHLCCFSTSVYCCCLFRYRLSSETFGYTLVQFCNVEERIMVEDVIEAICALQKVDSQIVSIWVRIFLNYVN